VIATIPAPAIGLLAVGVGAQHHELLAPKTTEHIAAAQALTDALAQFLQHPVTDRMPVLIVDPLEVIDIQHDHRQCPDVRLSRTISALRRSWK
jgi:hypothetical protein